MKRVVMILNDLMDAKIIQRLPAMTSVGVTEVQNQINRLNKELEMAFNAAIYTNGGPTKV